MFFFVLFIQLPNKQYGLKMRFTGSDAQVTSNSSYQIIVVELKVKH